MDKYFQNALSDFVFETACGGAIRHLADSGYTARQITDNLSYPVPYERVREAVTKHFLDSGVLLEMPPSQQRKAERFEYVQEHNEYGKPSFRRVQVKEEKSSSPESWREIHFARQENPAETEKAFMELLGRIAEENGDHAYVSCGFVRSLVLGNPGLSSAGCHPGLNSRQQEYLQGIVWGHKTMCHRLDGRMREILMAVYGDGMFAGEIYACRTGQIIHVP